MACNPEFIQYVCDQIADAGDVRYRKMFGEYMVYVDDKPILLVCDDTIFVKMADCVAALDGVEGTGYPYEGAKEHYILDPDNRQLLNDAVIGLCKITPVPVKKKRVSVK